ncbi:MAG TPA: GNAT family N-acetyltransferase [Myxococcota bacterium]|nr:GNAT family N-acetyltransferase [Myxococcota bacterium]
MRDAAPADFAAILALNEESVRFTSPLDATQLAALHGQAVLHRVAIVGDEIAAFLLALREGAQYESENYRWFAARYPRFLYVDRVVVSAAHRGERLGVELYEALFDFARVTNVRTITCEYDVDPPNPISQRFHARFGFREVGTQRAAGGKKRVSLQRLELPIP